MQITFDAPDLVRLQRTLSHYRRRGVPHAIRNTLNAMAFETRKSWVSEVQRTMTLRNTWTVRSLRVDKARGTRVAGMSATVGSVAPYMAVQEAGGVLRKRGRHGVPIPTPRASGEARGTRPRKRLVRRPNRLARIQLRKRFGKTREQRNAVAVAMALRSRRRFVFLETRRSRGIYRLMGGRRRPRLEMVWDLSEAAVTVPAGRTLEAALAGVVDKTPGLARAALVRQLRWRQ